MWQPGWEGSLKGEWIPVGIPKWLSGKESAREPGFDPWVEKILWRREWQSTPVFLPEFHGQRILVDYSLPGSSVPGISQAGILEWGAIDNQGR